MDHLVHSGPRRTPLRSQAGRPGYLWKTRRGIFVSSISTTIGLGADDGALRTRVAILEAAIACVQRECNTAFDAPEVAFATLCRIASVARQSLAAPDDAE